MSTKVAVGGDETRAAFLGFVGLADGIETAANCSPSSRNADMSSAHATLSRAKEPVFFVLRSPTFSSPALSRSPACAGMNGLSEHIICRDGSLARGIGSLSAMPMRRHSKIWPKPRTLPAPRHSRRAQDERCMTIGLAADKVHPHRRRRGKAGLHREHRRSAPPRIACAGAPICSSAHIAARAGAGDREQIAAAPGRI